MLSGLKQFDLHDVYRALHGYRRQDYSWYGIRAGRSDGLRFDHIFASASLRPTSCVYIHAFREWLSDHSALEATFAIQV